MSKITAIAWKDTLLAFSSRSQLLFFIILPVVFTFILGAAFDDGEGNSGIALLVVDQDGSQLSAALIETLRNDGTVAPEALPATDASARFADEAAPALLTIPEGFEALLLDGQQVELGLQKAFNSFSAEAADQAIVSAVATISRPLLIGRASVVAMEEIQPFSSEQTQMAAFKESVTLAQDRLALAKPANRIQVTGPVETASDNDYDAVAQASVGQLVTWVFIPLLGTSVLFASERARGTMRRLVITPARKSTYLLGAISGQMGQALVQMTLLVVFGVLVMKVDWGQSVPALALMLVTFGLASVALGVTMGTFVKTSSQANNLSIAIGMAMALLGGAWFPMEVFPETAQTVAKFLPTAWAVQGLNELVMRGGGLTDILLPAAVLLGFAALFFVIGVWRFRYE